MHNLRRAMVRPGRDRLSGIIEVDEADWGGKEEAVHDRQTTDMALIAVGAEADKTNLVRIRLRHIPECTRMTLHGFIAEAIKRASTAQTDSWQAYREQQGYVHQPVDQRRQPPDKAHLLPLVHLVISVLKRWLMGTHQGAVGSAYLWAYLDEFTFRFNLNSEAGIDELVQDAGADDRE